MNSPADSPLRLRAKNQPEVPPSVPVKPTILFRWVLPSLTLVTFLALIALGVGFMHTHKELVTLRNALSGTINVLQSLSSRQAEVVSGQLSIEQKLVEIEHGIATIPNQQQVAELKFQLDTFKIDLNNLRQSTLTAYNSLQDSEQALTKVSQLEQQYANSQRVLLNLQQQLRVLDAALNAGLVEGQRVSVPARIVSQDDGLPPVRSNVTANNEQISLRPIDLTTANPTPRPPSQPKSIFGTN